MARHLFCLVNRHIPGQDARWTGLVYGATCRHCGAAVRRRRKGVWTRCEESELEAFHI